MHVPGSMSDTESNIRQLSGSTSDSEFEKSEDRKEEDTLNLPDSENQTVKNQNADDSNNPGGALDVDVNSRPPDIFLVYPLY